MIERGEEAAFETLIPEQVELLFGQTAGGVEPFLLLGGLMDREQTFDEEGVVVETGGGAGFALGVTAQQAAALVARPGDQEFTRFRGSLDELGSIKNPA